MELRTYYISLLFLPILLAFSAFAHSADTTFSLREIDKSLQEIEMHAKNYPPTFDSQNQRVELSKKLKDVISLLDKASITYSEDTELLLRQAFANSLGHNLDFPNCAETAINSYDRLLLIDSNNRRANYFYGAFLSGTTLFYKSIPFLKKAIELGENEAHYALAFVYVKQDETQKALAEFKEYLKYDPENVIAKKMVLDIESGKLKLTIQIKPLSPQ